MVSLQNIIITHPGVAAKNLNDYLALARAKPGAMQYATSGIGSPGHLAASLLESMTGVQMTHVPYKGGPQTATAVMSGEATVAFNTPETIMGLVRGKRLRALAVSTRERAQALPDVPTAIELGIKDYGAIGWFGMFAPFGTPDPIIQRLSAEVRLALGNSAVQSRLATLGLRPIGSTSEEFRRYVNSEINYYADVVKLTGIKDE